jgi:hypothetical protein
MEKDELNDPTLEGLTMKEKRHAIAHRKRQEKLAVEDRISHLERFENEDKKNEFNVVFNALENFTGPVKDRERTDKKWIYPVAILIAIFLAHGFSGK